MKQIRVCCLLLMFCLSLSPLLAQDSESEPKLKHADPVYEDLITELGAKKGTNELNLNFGYRNFKQNHHLVLSQLEIEYAPIDNLGFEITLPYTAYFTNPAADLQRRDNRVEFLQWGSQYTFYSSLNQGLSLAISFQNTYGKDEDYEPENTNGFNVENIRYLPYLIAAKNWYDTWFLLFSGGSELNQDLSDNGVAFEHQLNTAFHYGFSENDHFVGIELNKSLEEGDFEMMIRPQLILEISDSFSLGSTIGIPLSIPETRWTAFLRLAYEFD